jgi:hypothetical protein
LHVVVTLFITWLRFANSAIAGLTVTPAATPAPASQPLAQTA